MSNFDLAHKFTALWEGGMSDHPADKGGVTAYGCSEKFVKGIAQSKNGIQKLHSIGITCPITRREMLAITKYQAKTLFKWEFWDKLQLDLLPVKPACVLYDCAVNHGCSRAVKIAQQGCNAMTVYGERLAVDGIMGPKTRNALKLATDKTIEKIIDMRVDFYNSIVKSDPTQKVFLDGWLNRANGLRKHVRGIKA